MIAILGGGMAGLACGWLLHRAGIPFTIYERDSKIGGLARSFEWHGFHCDFAAHRLFTQNEEVLQQLLQLVPMGRHIRRSGIYLQGHWLKDPLDVLELSMRLPPWESLELLGHYLLRPRDLPENSFEDFVLQRYGRGLYRVFFQPYTEKLFGIPGDEISVLWARQKVRLANPLDTLRENTKTKFSYFYYPIRGGYGAIPGRLYREIESAVLTQTTVTGLSSVGQEIREVQFLREGEEQRQPVEAVISTLPLPITGRMLGHPFNLNFQKVDAVYLWLNRPYVSDNHWLYFVDRDICINRLVEFKNLSAEGVPPDTTVLCAEVTAEVGEGERVADRVTHDLMKVGLIKEEEVLDRKVLREDYAYPVYDKQYAQSLDQAKQELGGYSNLHLVGRAAEFRHREVDDIFSNAMMVAGSISQRRRELVAEALPEKISRSSTMGRPLIYAVVLAHNNLADTRECLQSILASDYENLHTLLVDNASSDGTPERVAEEFGGEVEIIRSEQNLGVPAGYNLGFQHALEGGAEYILMLNNDTVIAEDMVRELVLAGDQDPAVGILMPKVLHYGTQDKIWSIGGRYRQFPPSIILSERDESLVDVPRMVEYAPGCGLLIHRRAFEMVGLFDPGYLFWYDDWDFSERVRTHGLHIRYVPQAEMWHKVSQTIQGPKSPHFWRTYGASAVRFYRRHGRPKWLSIPLHLGYLIAREFLWKRNGSYFGDFLEGMREGFRRPLGEYPRVDPSSGEFV